MSKVANALNKKTEYNKHKLSMQKLKNHHEAEMASVSHRQQKQIDEVKLNHKYSLMNLEQQNQQHLFDAARKQEDVLNNLKDNLQKVKEVTTAEHKRLLEYHNQKVDEQKQVHEAKVRLRSLKNEMKLDDINQTGNIEISKLKSELQSKKNQLSNTSKDQMKNQKQISNKKLQSQKEIYDMKQYAEDNKYHKALMHQKFSHEKHLTDNERKLNSRVSKLTEVKLNELKKIDLDSQAKKKQKAAHFEKEFSGLHKKNQHIIQNLYRRKEHLVHKLKQMLIKEYKLGLKKVDDPFYQFSKLETNIEVNQPKDGYLIKIPVPKHEAHLVDVRAEDRKVKVIMERRFNFDKSEKNSNDQISKVESFKKELAVDKILNPKTLTKSYNGKEVVFEVKFA